MNKVKNLTIKGSSSDDVWGFENSFYWFSHSSRLNKMLAHYELYKSIVNIPGDVLELGVYKAASLIRFATFRNLLENDFSRKIVGFDTFGAFPRDKVELELDHAFIDSFESEGGLGLSKGEIEQIFIRKQFSNIQLIEGNIFDTLSIYLNEFPATRIAILHLDLDVKEPTEYALDTLYDRLVPGGLVIFDDYSAVAGETQAVDNFLQKKCLQIQKLNYYKVPSFVRKPL